MYSYDMMIKMTVHLGTKKVNINDEFSKNLRIYIILY